MSRKSKDSTDELLQALRASLDEDGSPDDVFADQKAVTHSRETDDEIAAFDSYMAALLGEVVPQEQDVSEASTKKTSKTAKHKKNRASRAKSEAMTEQLSITESEAIVFSDVDAPEGAPIVEELPTAAEEALPSEELPYPDTQVELPEDVIGEEQPQIDAVFVTEQVAAEEAASLSSPTVIEQLRIPTDSFAQAALAQEMSASTEATPDMIVTAHSEQGTVGETVTEEGYLPVEGFAPEGLVEEQVEDEQNELSSLREGDIVIDADDETSHTPTSVTEPISAATTVSSPARVENGEKTSATPVASPLDAARNANAQAAAQAEAPRPKQSPLDAMAAERAAGKGNVSPLSGAPSLGRDRRERAMSDEDIELLLDLGYEKNLSSKIGSQRIETLKNRRTEDAQARKQLNHVYGCSGEEYSGHAQDEQVKQTYRKQLRNATVKLTFTVLLTLLIAVADLFPLFRHKLPEIFSVVPQTGLYGLLGMTLLVLTTLLSLPLLKRGIVSLFRFSPIPATLPAMLLIFTLLYDALGLTDAACGLMLNLPTALMLVLLCIGERCRIKSEKIAFSVVSARSRKIALCDMEPKKKKVIRDGHIVKIINDDADLALRRVRRAEQIGGYFRRTGEASERYRSLSPMLMVALLLAVLIGVVALLLKNDIRISATMFLLALQLMLPAAALVAHAYPMLLTADRLAKQGCAILGDSAVDQYATDGILLFDDTEMFRSKSSTEITIKGGGDTRKYVRYAKRLFRTLGGTLRNVTTSDLSEETYEDRVEILRVMEEGVEARIDGKVHILAGTSAFMVKNGIRVPSETAELLVRRHVESCILYLAFEGKLRLGYEIDYRISGRFESMVAELAKNDTTVAIESYDPCIHAEFLTRSREPGMTPIRVIKPIYFEKAVDSNVIDSGVVATRSARDIAGAVMACRRLADHDRRVRIICRVSLLLGAVLCGAMLLPEVVRPTIGALVALWQCVWCVPCVLLSRKNMINEQEQKK